MEKGFPLEVTIYTLKNFLDYVDAILDRDVDFDKGTMPQQEAEKLSHMYADCIEIANEADDFVRHTKIEFEHVCFDQISRKELENIRANIAGILARFEALQELFAIADVYGPPNRFFR